jgi:hypothetical protein
MAPSAITPPPVMVKPSGEINRPGMQRVDTSNIGTKRKIICFSGTQAICTGSEAQGGVSQLFAVALTC